MSRIASGLALALGLCTLANAQDLAVSQIGGGGDFRSYGSSNGVAAYSFGTTSCNVGAVPIRWDDTGGELHPVIGQNFFRIAEGRIEQLGYSWLKHGFCAVNENSCGSCQGTPCSTLGVGCADTYGSTLNDGQHGGGKFQTDPVTGYTPHPVAFPSAGTPLLRGRLQVRTAEIDPAANPDALYVAEAQYLTRDDHLAGNARNNASWREIRFSPALTVSGIGGTHMFDPAIYAWQALEEDVTIEEVVSVDEGGPGVHGWFFLGYKVTPLGGGEWRYEYALQNLNSDRAAGSFEIRAGCASTIRDVTFRDVDVHSGEPYSSEDWTVTRAGGVLRFETAPFARDPLANALRWGTLFNFGFTADRAPRLTTAAIGLFEPGTPSTLAVGVEGPCGDAICDVDSYCPTSPNSATSGAFLTTSGSTSLSANDLGLRVTAAALGQTGMFFYGTRAVQTVFGDGFRCVGGQVFRLAPVTADAFGDAVLSIDYAQPPFASGRGAARAGSTLYFQFWFRDPAAGGAGFNLSDALAISFCP